MGKPPAGPGAGPPPRANPLLLGHVEVERRIRRWIDADRLPHGLLIAGPPGVGKATLAYRIARALLASTADAPAGLFGAPAAGETASGPEPGGEEDPAGEVFRTVAQGTHRNLLTLERGYDDKRGRLRQDISIDEVRRLGAFFAVSAATSGWRVAVIDTADDLNRNSADALLKVLEEPGDACLLILLSHQPGRLSPTIRSRCRRLLLSPLDDDTLARLLSRYRPDLSPADATAIRALSGGSIGTALRIAARDGLAIDSELRGFFRSLADGDQGRALKRIESTAFPSDEDGFEVVALLLDVWLRRIVFAALGGAAAPSAGDPRPADEDLCRRLAASAPLDRWLQVWEKVSGLATQADAGNLDRKQTSTTVLLCLAVEVSAGSR